MMQIIVTTDGKFVGLVFSRAAALVLNGTVFSPDRVVELSPGVFRFSNSSYVIDAQEI